MALAIGVDIGGTKVAAGVVADDGTILEVLRGPTPDTEAPAVAAPSSTSSKRCATAIPACRPSASAPPAGSIAAARKVYFAPNVVWRDEPIRDDLAARIDLPIVVENDGNATAWAEHRFGAGRGSPDLICVTIGTGIGGGMVASGALYRGGFGIAAEFGHMQLVPDGHRCGCGRRGCWEQYCSGKALVREAREIAGADPVQGRRMLELAGGEADDITGPIVTLAAEEGDPAAVEAFATIGEWLGRGLANVTAALDPGLVRHRRRGVRRRRPAARARPASGITAACLAAASVRRPNWSARCSARRPAWWAPPTSRGCR